MLNYIKGRETEYLRIHTIVILFAILAFQIIMPNGLRAQICTSFDYNMSTIARIRKHNSRQGRR